MSPTFGSLFAGIGGIDLGLERAGWTGRWQVEWDPFCQHVLAHHWPDVARVGDIRGAHGTDYCPRTEQRRAMADTDDGGSLHAVRAGRDAAGDGGTDRCPGCLPPVDLIAGGFPCQPFSFAGKQRGKDDERWLWPEFARVVRELRPRYVLVENVPGLLAGHGGMGAVLGDLASLGYDAEWESIPAAAVGAPHLRYRVWIVAYANGERLPQPRGVTESVGEAFGSVAGSGVEDATSGGREWRGTDPGAPAGGWAFGLPAGPGEGDGPGWWLTEPDVGRVAHGVPARVDRLRALGNAVVPQVVEVIGRRLMAATV